MKYYELTKEEEGLLEDYEKGQLKSVAKPQTKKHYRQYAQSTLSKTKNINIRVSEKDLLKVKARAANKGIPYQTLLASVVHQYSTDQLNDRSE